MIKIKELITAKKNFLPNGHKYGAVTLSKGGSVILNEVLNVILRLRSG